MANTNKKIVRKNPVAKPANTDVTKPDENIKNEQNKKNEEADVEETEKANQELDTEATTSEIVVETDVMVRIQKLGGGAIYLPKKIIKPGETCWVRKSDIPVAFMDSIKILEEKGGVKTVVKKKIYEAQEQTDGTFWVINLETGKPISKDLEAEEAAKIAQSLNA